MPSPDRQISDVSLARLVDNGRSRVILGRDMEGELRRQVSYVTVLVEEARRDGGVVKWDNIIMLRYSDVARFLATEMSPGDDLYRGLLVEAANRELLVDSAYVMTNHRLGIRLIPDQLSLWRRMDAEPRSIQLIVSPPKLRSRFRHPNRGR